MTGTDEEARLDRHDKLHEAIRYTERERDTALSEKVALEGIVEGLRGVLERIAARPRPDGTYNLSREACEQIARKALYD